MRTMTTDLPERRAALIAGVGYLVIFGLAIFANFFVRTDLVEPDDAAATVANIVDAEALFRAGLVAFLVVFVLDIVIAWALYVFFRPVRADLSLLAAWFRLVYTTLLGVALIAFFVVLELIRGGGPLAAIGGQRDAQVMLFLDAFNFGWLIGLACFGVHLILLGVLILKAERIPQVLGVLLLLSGAAYVIDTLAHALLGNYDDYETLFLLIVAVPSLIGELAFPLWLLLRGGRERPARVGWSGGGTP